MTVVATDAEQIRTELLRCHFAGPAQDLMMMYPKALEAKDLEKVISHVQHGPEMLWFAWTEGCITLETLQALVGSVWSDTDYPDWHMGSGSLDHNEWRQLFKAAGFTVDGKPAPRPDEPIVLYRGSVPRRCRDWSWTTDRAMAEKYALGGLNGRPEGRVYKVIAPPSALMCANFDRGEFEYVVDTEGLDITEA